MNLLVILLNIVRNIMENLKIVNYPNGYAALIYPDDTNPFSSIADFDEGLSNVLSFKVGSVENLNPEFFHTKNDIFEYVSNLVTNAQYDDEKDENALSNIVNKLKAVAELNGASYLKEVPEIAEKVAQRIYKENWKPIIQSQLEYLQEIKEDAAEFNRFYTNTTLGLHLESFEFFNDYFSNINDFDGLEEIETWIKYYQNKLEKFDLKITVAELDQVMDYFDHIDSSVIDGHLFFMIPDPQITKRYVESVVDMLIQQPYVYTIRLYYSGYGTKAVWVTNGDFDIMSGVVFVNNYNQEIDQKLTTIEYFQATLTELNNFLEGCFYSAELIFIPEKGTEHLYPQGEYSYDLKLFVVSNIDECNLILGLDNAESYFDYIKEQPPYDPTYNYGALGSVVNPK